MSSQKPQEPTGPQKPMPNPSERAYLVAALIIGICGIVAAWIGGRSSGVSSGQQQAFATAGIQQATSVAEGASTQAVVTSPPIVITSPPIVITSPPIVMTSPPILITAPPAPTAPVQSATIQQWEETFFDRPLGTILSDWGDTRASVLSGPNGKNCMSSQVDEPGNGTRFTISRDVQLPPEFEFMIDVVYRDCCGRNATLDIVDTAGNEASIGFEVGEDHLRANVAGTEQGTSQKRGIQSLKVVYRSGTMKVYGNDNFLASANVGTLKQPNRFLITSELHDLCFYRFAIQPASQ